MFKKIFRNPLISGSVVLFVGSSFINFGNYLYHLLLGRMLGPQAYGSLTSLISLIYIFSIISGTFSLTLIKFVTKYKTKKDYRRIYWLFWQFIKKFFVFGLLVFSFFVIARGKIGEFLNLDNSFPVILVGGLLFLIFLSFINDSLLRGFLKFGFISLNGVFSVLLKLSLAVILVKCGFSVTGALWAMIISLLIPYLISFYPLKFLWQYRDGREKIDWREIFSYSTPVFISTLGLTSLYSSDVILVKHLFPAYEAGLYASLAMMGKIVFFASSTVSAVMFPLVSEKFENNGDHQKILKQSVQIVSLISLGLTAVYFLVPKLMIKLLYGEAYLEGSGFLGVFAIFITLYALSSLLINYFLSVKKVKLGLLPFLAALLQIILIWFFHATLIQVIIVSITVTTLLFGSLLLCYWQHEKARNSFSFSRHSRL